MLFRNFLPLISLKLPPKEDSTMINLTWGIFLGLSLTLTENTNGSRAGTTWRWVILRSLSQISWSKTGLQTYQIIEQVGSKTLILRKLRNSNQIQGILWTLFIKLKHSHGGISLRWVRLKEAHQKLRNLLLQGGRWIMSMIFKGVLLKIEGRCQWRKKLGKIKWSCPGWRITQELRGKEVEFLEILNQPKTMPMYRWKTLITPKLNMKQSLQWALKLIKNKTSLLQAN
jgi:hypothetical protein